jgi:hypothetical protein
MEFTPEQKLEALRLQLPRAPIAQIAAIILKDWGSSVNYAAKPYLRAMLSLTNLQSMHGADDGRSIVQYFLSNAQTWRGPIARVVKAELNKRLAS